MRSGITIGVAVGLVGVGACGAPRETLPPPREPLVAHLALPPRPPPPEPAAMGPATSIETFVLPCGIEVHLADRPHAVLTYFALYAGGGHLGDGSPIAVDLAVTYAIEDHVDGRAALDRRGLILTSRSGSAETIERAVELVRVVGGESLPVSLLARAGESIEASGTSRMEHDLVSRVYGGRSPEAAYANPRVGRHFVPAVPIRARIAQVFDPARMRLVVVGDVDRATLEAQLAAATRDVAATPHAAPREIEIAPWAPPRPQIRGYGSDISLGHIAGLAAGPALDDPSHAAFRVAATILGGMYSSRANLVFRDERRETYGAHAAVFDRGTHALVRFETTVETPQLGSVLELLFDELDRLGTLERLSEEEVARARRLEIVREVARWDDAEALAMAILEARIHGLRASPQHAIEAIMTVNAEAVAEVSRHWLAPHRLALIVSGRSDWMFTHPLSAPGGYAAAEP